MKFSAPVLGLLFLAASCSQGPDFSSFDKLVADKQYESAWHSLEALPQSDEVLARKIGLCLEYSVANAAYASFALKDLAAGETLAELRQPGKTFKLYQLDVPAQIGLWQSTHAHSFLLDRALGDFYFKVSQAEKSYGSMNHGQIVQEGLSAYARAWNNGPFTGRSGDSYARLLADADLWEQSVVVLDRLIGSGEPHPDARYNKAYALLQNKKYDDAAAEAKKAYQEYADAGSQEDALVLSFDIELARGQLEAAAALLAQVGDNPKSPNRVTRRRIELALEQKNYPAAAAAGRAYLESNAGDLAVVQGLLLDYKNRAPLELDSFAGNQIEYFRQRGPAGTEGLLRALWAHLLLDAGRKAEAKAQIESAEAAFKKAGDNRPEVAVYLKQLKSRY